MNIKGILVGAALTGLIAGATSAQQIIVDDKANANSGAQLFGATADGSFGIAGSSTLSGGASGIATALSSDAATNTTSTTGTTSTTN